MLELARYQKMSTDHNVLVSARTQTHRFLKNLDSDDLPDNPMAYFPDADDPTDTPYVEGD